MGMTLTLQGGGELDGVVASVLGRLATAAGLPEGEACHLLDGVSRALDGARGRSGEPVRVAFAWALDRIEVEVGPADSPERFSRVVPVPEGPAGLEGTGGPSAR